MIEQGLEDEVTDSTIEVLRELADRFERRADSVLLGSEFGRGRRHAFLSCADAVRSRMAELEVNNASDCSDPV